MEIPFLHLKTNERNTVPQPEGIDLFRAALWMAAGMVGISFLATSLPMKFKLILCILGGIFCVVGIIRLFKYHKAYKVFQNFMPTWDFARGIYDQFAMELNAWHETDTVPTCCDGDTLYFLKLQKERLKRKGLKMSDQILPAKESGSGTATLSRKSLWYTSDMVYENISRSSGLTIRREPFMKEMWSRSCTRLLSTAPMKRSLPTSPPPAPIVGPSVRLLH